MYVKGITQQEAPVLLCADEYAPLTAQVGNSEHKEIYLRYVSDYSLLELGVSSHDGALTSLKLVQADGLSPMNMPSFPSTVDDGLPLFDISCWKGKRLLDIERPVALALSDSSAFLVLDRSRKADKLARYKNLSLGMSEGYPCWILIEGLEKKQILGIKGSVENSSRGSFL